MSPKSRLRLRTLVAAALTLAPVLLLAGPAAAANATITFKCRANSPLGAVDLSLNQGAEASAPATVAPGGSLSVVVDPAPNEVPSQVDGRTLKALKNFTLKIPVPANSTYVSATLSGGSGVGTPTITLQGNTLVLKVTSSLAGGAKFELPTVTVNLKAGNSGTIQSRLGGTSYADPGLTFTASVVVLFTIDVPTACYPDPNPALTTTTIG